MANLDSYFQAEQALRGDLDGWLHDHVEQEGDCLIWAHGCWKDGRGPIMRLPRALPAQPKKESKKVVVARIVWEQANGKALRPNWLVWQSCGNTLCVNPSHLQAGTRNAMIAAKTRQGVFKLSEATKAKRAKTAQARSNLTWDDVLMIRAEVAATPILRFDVQKQAAPTGMGRTGKMQELAERYGISVRSIQAIVKGERWREKYSEQNPFSQLLRLAA